MRYAIVSDLHANLQAWETVLQDINSSNVDHIICLGDIIGYGPQPAAVLQSVHAHADYMIMGNHDAAIAGKLSIDLFNPRARQRIKWTAENLSKKAIKVLGDLPLSVAGEDFRCTHGEFSDPGQFQYIFEPHEAARSWEITEEQLLFVGHTHAPGIFLIGNSGKSHAVPPQDFLLETGKRYLVNVGSVGVPRDGDPRASYCIYDSTARSVVWRRIPFDLRALKRDLRQAGLNEDCMHFLADSEKVAASPVRERINFAPAKTKRQGVQGVDEDQIVHQIRQQTKRWKTLSMIVTLIAASSIAAAMIFRNAETVQSKAIPPDALPMQSGHHVVPDQNMLPPIPRESPSGSGIPGWRLILGNKENQSITFVATENGPAVQLRSDDPDTAIILEAPPLTVRDNGKIQATFLNRRGKAFSGALQVIVDLEKQLDEKNIQQAALISKVATMRRKNDWYAASQTEALPKGSRLIKPRLEAQFTGTILLAAPELHIRYE